MSQNQNDVKRQAIQEQKKAEKAEQQRKQTEVLSGIIDNETKTYTFQKTMTINGGEKKDGTFKAKYMGVAARLRIGTLRAKFLDGAPAQSLDNLTDDIAYMMAYLTVALVEKPNWFSFEVLDEFPELRDLYREVYEFNQSFRRNDGTSADAGRGEDAAGKEDVETQ